MACSDTRASDRSRTRTDTPALPFCHLVIKAEKPRDSAYPIKNQTLGDRLRARRLDLGFYQKDVAALLGVTEDSVCYWENNRVKPRRGLMPRLMRFLDQFRALE